MLNIGRHWIVAALLSLASTSHASDENSNPEQQLGRMLYTDVNLSLQRNQSCNSCHPLQPMPRARHLAARSVTGFVDPDNVRDGSAVSKGSIAGVTGCGRVGRRPE